MKTAGFDLVQRDIWAQLRSAPDWQTAFAAASGVTADRFHTDFEEYRLTL